MDSETYNSNFRVLQSRLRASKTLFKELLKEYKTLYNTGVEWSLDWETAIRDSYNKCLIENIKFHELWVAREYIILNAPVGVQIPPLSPKNCLPMMYPATHVDYYDVDGNRCGPNDPRRRGYNPDEE